MTNVINDKNPPIPQVKNIVQFTNEFQMQINTKKTNVMLFNKSRLLDFQPEIFINDELLDVVESTKILGIMLSSNMKWDENIEYIRSKAMKKLWMLRRIRELGGSTQDMLDVYILKIRCLAEIACPAWNGSITVKHSNILERIQKSAMRIILGQNYKSYKNALKKLDLKSLAERRKDICLTFAKKASKSSKYQAWFKRTKWKLRDNVQFLLPKTSTVRYKKSPLIYLTNLLNENS